MAACGGVATRGLMPGIRIHEIYAVGSIAEAPFALAGTHTIHYTAPASTSASSKTVVQRCGGAAHSGAAF